MDEAVEAAFRAIWEREPIRGTGDDGRLAAMARALSAADAARAVGDDEVVRVLDDNFTRLEALNVLELLQAAGLEVVRG